MLLKRLTAWFGFLAFAGGLGVGIGMLDSRFDIFANLDERLEIAARSFSVPSEFPNPDRGAGELYAVDDCACRRDNWQCQCPATRPATSEEARIAEALSQRPAPVRFRPSENFENRLRSATGYGRIEPADQPIFVGRDATYLDGQLREVFFSYRAPSILVRGLMLTHEDTVPDTLFIHTPASWTKAETAIGIGDPMYLREVGKVVFEQGYDVVSLDHGSNGHIESALNGYSIMTAGVQSYGLWARSTCDAVAMLEANGRSYDRVVVYGLSRGNHTVEYIRALCDRIDLAIGDATWSPDAYVAAYWRVEEPFVHSGKYGSFFFHAQSLVGPMSAHDLPSLSANPNAQMIFLMSRQKSDETLPDMSRSFEIADGYSGAPFLFAMKRTELHEPELEQILEILNGDTSQIEAVSLTPVTRETN